MLMASVNTYRTNQPEMKIRNHDDRIIMLNTTTIDKFKGRPARRITQRNDPQYEEARKLYNAMIDKKPLLIARCADVADVIAAVHFGPGE